MDEVLSSFFGRALEVCNKSFGTDISREEYIEGNYGWLMKAAFNVSDEDMWGAINSDSTFWSNLKILPWAKDIYEYLKTKGDVTIVSSPSHDPGCWSDKVTWLKNNLGIEPGDVMLGQKKYLLAGNGVLIDDSPDNIRKFEEAGGKGILVPAEWNTKEIVFERDILPLLKKEFEDEE